MADYQMEIIPEPEEGQIALLKLEKKGQHSIIKGGGKDNCLCGICGNAICKDVNRGQIANLGFQCPNCGSFNWLAALM